MIVSVAGGTFAAATLFFVIWAMWEAERRRNTWLFVVMGAGALVFMGWTWWGARRDHRELDHYMEAVGLDPAQIPDEPIPVLPPRGDRAGLVLGIVFLLVVAALAVANYLGWLEGFAPPERRK